MNFTRYKYEKHLGSIQTSSPMAFGHDQPDSAFPRIDIGNYLSNGLKITKIGRKLPDLYATSTQLTVYWPDFNLFWSSSITFLI